MKQKIFLISFLVLLILVSSSSAIAQDRRPDDPIGLTAELGNGISYQGRLEEAGGPINGNCDFRFSLFDSLSGGSQIGSTLTRTNTPVSDGFFTIAELDFGNRTFVGEQRFLKIEVRCPTGSGSYIPLSPRQEIMPAPYAINVKNVTAYNPNNPGTPSLAGASVALSWYNDGSKDWPRIRYGGNNEGSENGFLIQGPGDYTKFTILENSNVGIGNNNTNPSARLDISGGSILLDANQSIYGHQTSGNRGFIELYNSSNGDMSLGTTYGTGDIRFTTGGSESVIFTYSGRVGINQTNPTPLLHVTSTGGNDAKLYLEANADDPSVNFRGDSTQYGVIGYDYDAGMMRFVYGTSLGNDTGININSSGQVGIGKNPSYMLDVDGTSQTQVLRITGGSDLAEPFEITGEENVIPGMIVSIDPENPGQLQISTEAYDFKVAGCVSGANGINPGLVMHQEGTEASGTFPVALSGRVYCWADASYGAIHPGDLLTTSDIPGYAMKVNDYQAAQGSILGKAMSSLEEGTGLILILVTLQ